MDINYDRCNVSNRLRTEIVRARGECFWKQLSEELLVPSDEMDDRQCSACMRAFMEKFQSMLPVDEIKPIMVNVRHDLQQDDFDWAVRLFNQMGSIDQFSIELQKICIEANFPGYDPQADPGDQPVDREVMEYIQANNDLFYGRRYGDEIFAQAIPYDLHGYLHAADDQQRRYAVCHCQFGRESILQTEGQVSPLLCECSLGHTMILWETVLGTKLEGEVVESALKGSSRCLFKIRLPAGIVERCT